MTNWFTNFQNKYNWDANPKLTKFFTLTLMPCACLFLLYMSFHFYKLTSRTKNDYQFVKGMIADVRRIDFPTKGNEAPSFAIDITIDQKTYSLHNAYLSNDNKVSAITVGKTADIYFDNQKDKNEVTEMYVDGEEVLTAGQTNHHFKVLRNLTFVFGLLFTIWFASRIYRYVKHGGLNKTSA